MLEAIDMYGIGNWVDCADHVGTKTKDECETHYFLIYFDSPTAPLPVRVHRHGQWFNVN